MIEFLFISLLSCHILLWLYICVGVAQRKEQPPLTAVFWLLLALCLPLLGFILYENPIQPKRREPSC